MKLGVMHKYTCQRPSWTDKMKEEVRQIYLLMIGGIYQGTVLWIEIFQS